MLQKQLQHYIEEHIQNNEIALFAIEKDFVEKHQLLPTEVTVIDKALLLDVLERCNKETEDLISAEPKEFLQQPISYLKEHPIEFVYAESTVFDVIRIDAVALEFDDAFKAYTALFGLKLQKKFGDAIRAYFEGNVAKMIGNYSVSFSGQDGLWEVNVALNCIDGFTEAQTFEESYALLYRFIFNLIEAADEAQ
ncbi:branched-chain amino acid aminotransferase [Solibacillus sp. FSL H8-0538]|uniref:branched-chain amino acid aminotransferase n=1 Tax=Solibacillus sp. FSL H8-0538 TaxID=2921400 RepID=UPI0030FC5B7C